MRRRFVWSYEYIENIHASSIFFVSLGIGTSGGSSRWRHFQLSHFSSFLSLPSLLLLTAIAWIFLAIQLKMGRAWRFAGLNAGHKAMCSYWDPGKQGKTDVHDNLHLHLVRGHDSSHDSSIWAYIDKSGINRLQDHNQPIEHDTWSLNPTSSQPTIHDLQTRNYKRNLELKTTCLIPPHNMSFSQAERHGMAWHVPFGETGKSLFTGSS